MRFCQVIAFYPMKSLPGFQTILNFGVNRPVSLDIRHRELYIPPFDQIVFFFEIISKLIVIFIRYKLFLKGQNFMPDDFLNKICVDLTV